MPIQNSLLGLLVLTLAGVALADIDSLWVQRGSAALLLGIVIGAPCTLFGALVGEFIAVAIGVRTFTESRYLTPANNELGWKMSLSKLAALVENG